MIRSALFDSLKHRIAVLFQDLHHINMPLTDRGRRSVTRLAEFRDRYQGKTCIILGNGPSLKNCDLSSLDAYATFCMNRGYLLWREATRKPTFFMAVNDLVVEQFSDEIAQLDCPLFLPWRYRNLFRENANAIFVRIRWDHAFQEDVTRGVWPGATVTMAALQMAYHMGFTRVILLGIDHRFDSQGKPHTQIQQESDDPNHFHPDYFGHGTLWNLPDLQQSEVSYAIAKQVFEADGREIINATPGTALDVFEKRNLSELIQSTAEPEEAVSQT